MFVIVTYDLEDRHIEFKEQMINLGYSALGTLSTGEVIQLPNTTVLKDNHTKESALNDVASVANHLGCKVLRVIVIDQCSSQTSIGFGPKIQT